MKLKEWLQHGWWPLSAIYKLQIAIEALWQQLTTLEQRIQLLEHHPAIKAIVTPGIPHLKINKRK